MKNFFILAMLIATMAISCKKDDSIPETREKKVLLARTSTTYSYDGSTVITEYTYDDNGRIVGELEDKGTKNEELVTYTYDSKGNITAQKFPNRGSLRNEYGYDNQNRMISVQRYQADGSNNGKSTYAYFDNRIEETRTSKAGYNTKQVLTYTTDKKNIGNLKIYDIKGNLFIDQTYTFANIKDPIKTVSPPTPYALSINLAEKIISVDYDDPTSPNTQTYTYNYVAHTNGYPSSVTEISNGKLRVTTTYEYIVK